MSDEEIHRAAVEAIEEWDYSMESHHQLVRDLRDYLNGRVPGLVTRPADSLCDLSAGDVGFLIYTDFDSKASAELKRHGDHLSDTYDYLIIYGHDLSAEDFDRWRMGEFKHAALGLDLEDVTFIRHSEDTGTAVGENAWPSRVWRFAQAIVALLAIVIGLELAVLYQLEFARGYAQMGPVPTFIIVVALSTALVWLYNKVNV